MISKPLLPWSKRQHGPEISPRTSGLLPTLKHRASRLVLLPSDDKQNASSSVTTHYDTALADAVGNLHIAVNDMLNSRSSSVRRPSCDRPQSTSASLVVELPAELPDSILLEDGDEYQQPRMQSVHEKIALKASEPGVPELVHARSILGVGSSYNLRTKDHNNNASTANDTAQFEMLRMRRNSSFTAVSMLRRRLDFDAMKSFAAVIRSEFVKSGSTISNQQAHMPKGHIEVASSEPSPIATHSEYAPEPESNNTPQNYAMSTLQSQFDSSKESCESHLDALKRWHSVQVASFETQAQLYKERTNDYSLQDSGSIWLTEPHSNDSPHARIHDRVEELANLNTPSRCELADQQLSPRQPPISPQKENLKPESLGTPGLDPITQCFLSESSLYEQDRVALQKQIDMLTAKLSNSNNNERELRSALAITKRESADKTMNNNKLAEKIQALHNTVAHLESRLEVANIKRLDAEEQLLAWGDHKSPFDLMSSEQPALTDSHRAALDIQIDTGNNIYSPKKAAYASRVGCVEKTTPAALVARIGELQTQVKKKDACIAGLETKLKQLQEKYCLLQHNHKRVAVQVDLQHELLRETRASDKLIEQLRTAVINHESTIMENEQTVYALRRQLEHHKLLLQAEIRRHAAIKLYVAAEEHPLPELTSLAKREDIHCWIEKLHERLRREQSENEGNAVPDTPEVTIESLRHEIDFYLNEIILFKLDIKGYRSDIRKLKEMATHPSSSQKLPDTEREPSPIGTVVSPVESSFAPITSELNDLLGASPAMGHTDTVSRSEVCSIIPSPSVRLYEKRTGKASDQLPELETIRDFRNSKRNHSSKSKPNSVDSAFSPCSNALQVSEHLTASCSLNRINKRSMSAPPLRLHQWPVTLDGPTIEEKGVASKAEWEAVSYRRCTDMADASKPPLNLQIGISQLMDGPSSTELTVPKPSGPCETPAAYIAPQSPAESTFRAESVLSTTSDYFAQSAPLSEGTLGNTVAPGVKAAAESPRKPGHVEPPIATHVKGCLITSCALTDAVRVTSQPSTTMISSTYIHSPVSNTKSSREESILKVKALQNTPPMLPASDVEAGVVSGPVQGWYRSLPSMLSQLRRQSASSISSVDSCQKLVAGVKSEACMYPGKV